MSDTPTEPTNEIDLLMSLDPLQYTKLDIDRIVAYHRNQRAQREAGGPRTRTKKDSGPALDLEKLGLKPAAPKIDRRI